MISRIDRGLHRLRTWYGLPLYTLLLATSTWTTTMWAATLWEHLR